MPFSSIQENMKAPRAESLHHKGHTWVHSIHSQLSSEQLRDAILLMPPRSQSLPQTTPGAPYFIAKLISYWVPLMYCVYKKDIYLTCLAWVSPSPGMWSWLTRLGTPWVLTPTLHTHYRNVYKSVSMYSYFTTCWSLRGCCGWVCSHHHLGCSIVVWVCTELLICVHISQKG